MAYVAVDNEGNEAVYQYLPTRTSLGYWSCTSPYYSEGFDCVYLPKGSINKLIGHSLTWENEPVKLN